MESPREWVAFLSRSENRVTVLGALGADPTDRATLRTETGVERVTLGRILADFEDRGWVRKRQGEYALTPTGEMVAGGFERLQGTVRAAQKLDAVVEWLPTDEMAFDLERFGTAEIVLPGPSDPAAPTRRAAQRLRGTDDVRLLMSVIVAEVLEACLEATVDGQQRLDAVFTADVIETIASDPDMSDMVGELCAEGDVTIRVADDAFVHTIGLLDDIVAFGVVDEEHLPRAYIETADEEIRAWAEAVYADHRQRAERLDPEALVATPEGLPEDLETYLHAE